MLQLTEAKKDWIGHVMIVCLVLASLALCSLIRVYSVPAPPIPKEDWIDICGQYQGGTGENKDYEVTIIKEEDNIIRMYWYLGKATPYIGTVKRTAVINFYNEQEYTPNADGWNPIGIYEWQVINRKPLVLGSKRHAWKLTMKGPDL